MSTVNDWIQTARVRTLPLAGACVMVGGAVAHRLAQTSDLASERFTTVFAAICATVIALQILSNYANDYGDFEHGADGPERQDRGVASGRITQRAMRRAVRAWAGIALFLGVGTLWLALHGTGLFVQAIALLLLGLVSIGAAYSYTAGSKPYGYVGLGDIAVFLFFGLLGVLGSAFLLSHSWSWSWLLPATFVGAMSVAVLNLNNLRDIDSDRHAGKHTLPVRMGYRLGTRYHVGLFVLGWTALLIFTLVLEAGMWRGMLWIGLLGLVHIQHVLRILRIEDPQLLDPELQRIALSTAVVALFLLLAQTQSVTP